MDAAGEAHKTRLPVCDSAPCWEPWCPWHAEGCCPESCEHTLASPQALHCFCAQWIARVQAMPGRPVTAAEPVPSAGRAFALPFQPFVALGKSLPSGIALPSPWRLPHTCIYRERAAVVLLSSAGAVLALLRCCCLCFDSPCLIKIQSLGSKSGAHISMQKQMQIRERSCWLMQVSRGWCCPSINLFPVLAFIFDLIASLGSGISTAFSCGIACIGTEYVSNQIQHQFFHSVWNSAALGCQLFC